MNFKHPLLISIKYAQMIMVSRCLKVHDAKSMNIPFHNLSIVPPTQISSIGSIGRLNLGNHHQCMWLLNISVESVLVAPHSAWLYSYWRRLNRSEAKQYRAARDPCFMLNHLTFVLWFWCNSRNATLYVLMRFIKKLSCWTTVVSVCPRPPRSSSSTVKFCEGVTASGKPAVPAPTTM